MGSQKTSFGGEESRVLGNCDSENQGDESPSGAMRLSCPRESSVEAEQWEILPLVYGELDQMSWKKEAESEEQGSDRSRFRTAPGGGKNRVSGGRAKAAAYVSPMTLNPGFAKILTTAPIKISEKAIRASQDYQTEPSLLRRRESQPSLTSRDHGPLKAAAMGVLIAFISVASTYWLVTPADELFGSEKKLSSAQEEPLKASSSTLSEPKKEEAKAATSASQEEKKKVSLRALTKESHSASEEKRKSLSSPDSARQKEGSSSQKKSAAQP